MMFLTTLDMVPNRGDEVGFQIFFMRNKLSRFCRQEARIIFGNTERRENNLNQLDQ